MARVLHYEDLALAIEPEGPESFRVDVLSSPYGLTTAPFALPFGRRELEGMLAHLGDRIVAPPGVRFERSPAPESEFRALGARLFQALFQGAVWEVYLLSRGRSEARPDHGLRIRLILPTAAEEPLLQALPWELLFCAQTDEFVARNALTPVVRQLRIPWASAAYGTAAERVRILIAVAAPRGPDPLDDVEERARILAAWCQRQNAAVEVLFPATLAALREELRSEHYQVVHFIGHGTFDSTAGRGAVLFETADREPHPVSGSLLAETLRESRELRLVFLNACQTAQSGYLPGQDPLLGTAAALVRRGVPAVIAMQFPISDGAAKVFSEAVYRSLARGSALDEAVSDGRAALHQADTASWEWVTPALFTALSGPEVFRPLCAAVARPSHRPDETAALAANLLSTRSYARARQALESCLAEVSDRSDLHYYLALALLGDRRPRFLKGEELKPIESSASRVLHLADCAAHHLCFLAFLRKDFYLDNYLVSPAPGVEALLRRAAAAPRQPDRLAELVELVPWAKPVVDQVHPQAGDPPP